MRNTSDKVGIFPWLLAVLLFPAGMFILLGVGKVLPWFRAVLLILLTCSSLAAFAWLMGELEKHKAGQSILLVASLAGGLLLVAWSAIAYVVGRRAGFWSDAHLRGWRRLGWSMLGIGVFLVVADAALLFLLSVE